MCSPALGFYVVVRVHDGGRCRRKVASIVGEDNVPERCIVVLNEVACIEVTIDSIKRKKIFFEMGHSVKVWGEAAHVVP